MKRIGIPGWLTGDTTFGAAISYLEFIYRFGVPVILTPKDSLNPPEVDMILAPGGADMLPSSYKSMPSFRTNKPNIMLEHFDAETLPQYIERKTPIFAVCRSMQRIWSMYGGRIEQHNDWHAQSKHQYDMCHELEFTEGYKGYSKEIKKVTSRHHQCADASVSKPDDLDIIAYAKEGNTYFTSVVEIFRHKTLPIFGVQFHPEDHDDTDKLSSAIVKEFLNI